MTDFDNKENLFEAIENYPLLTKNPKKILKALSMFDKPVPAESIVQASSLVKQVVYPSLTKMLKTDLIIKSKPQNSSCNLFEINKLKLFELLELHIKTKTIKSQI
jgi:RIO-like serine/threonine protein kinase